MGGLATSTGHRNILMSAAPTSMAVADDVVLGLIRAPTVDLAWRKRFANSSDRGRQFERAIPRSQMITYPQVGHTSPDRDSVPLRTRRRGIPALSGRLGVVPRMYSVIRSVLPTTSRYAQSMTSFRVLLGIRQKSWRHLR
jgi:hypothetical protein